MKLRVYLSGVVVNSLSRSSAVYDLYSVSNQIDLLDLETML